MTIGWNIGNSLEVPDGETAWGNPMVDQQLIDAVKDAGFNTVRIPCAWNSYANQTTFEIDPAWLARVKEVVDYCRANDMFVIINSHWDGGWLEERPFYWAQEEVNEKHHAYWTQIAQYFSDYDEHLLFSGTNEVRADYGTPTAEHIEVQESYNQTFVDAVRATGGNNLNRILIVQTYNTNMWHGLDYFTMPTDVTPDRLMVEVHYYDPYDFTLNTDLNVACTVWGQPFAGGDVCNWGQENYVEDLFSQIKQEWVDNGAPIILGEYGVIKRTGLSGQAYDQHIAAREYYLEYITDASKRHGIIPIYWDNGFNGENGLALFDRHTGSVTDQGALDALMRGAGVGDPNATYTLDVSAAGSGAVSLSPSGGVYSGGTAVTVTATPDPGWQFIGWSGDLSGSANPAVVTMSGDKSATAIFAEEGVAGTGTILREYWTGIAGTSINSLLSHEDYPANPSGSEQIESLEGPVDWDDNYGTRIRGYVHPPVTGSYTFWVAGDDHTDLYLSADDSPSNASRIAWVEGWTNSRQWTKYASQSATVNLVAGQKYYIEALHKEGSGGDNLAVAWQGPGLSQSVIDGAYLSPYQTKPGPEQYQLAAAANGSGSVSLDPAGGTYDEGTQVMLTATPDPGWQFTGWSGDLSGSANPAMVAMNGNRSVTANFTQNQSGDLCEDPAAISLPFTQEGPGEYCFTTTGHIDYINSWAMASVEINGQDFTNTWSNSMPQPIDGAYFIRYSGQHAWSHLEIHTANARKSAENLAQEIDGVGLYPNPFAESLTLTLSDPETVTSLSIHDQLGRLVETIDRGKMAASMQVGANLKAGVYFIRIDRSAGTHTLRIVKNP